MYQHVNNAVYITYFEEARAYFWRHLMAERFVGFDFIIAEVTCGYLSPAQLAETLDIEVTVGAIGTKSFHLNYMIRSLDDGRDIARGRSVQVAYDHTAQASHPLAPDVRARLEAAVAPVER
jgi:acyl-CoA thioester hydrolase